MELTTFDFGDVCLGTIEDDDKTVNAQGVVTFGKHAMLQLADTAIGRLGRLKDVEPGFISFVGADGLALEDRDYQTIAAIPGLRSVDFDNTSINDDQVGYFCQDGMVGLNLATPSVGDGAMAAIASISTLGHLFLARSSVSDTGLAALAHHATLDTLHVPGTNVTAGSASTLATLRSLAVLHMDGADDDVLVAVARPHTTWLHFRDAAISGRGMSALAVCAELQTFGLIRSRLDADACRAIGAITSLTSMWLTESRVDDAALAVGLGRLENLEFLGAASTAVGDVCAEALGSLRRLAVLQLARTQLTDSGIAHLASVPGLEQVNVEDTAVTPQGLALLTQLPRPFALG